MLGGVRDRQVHVFGIAFDEDACRLARYVQRRNALTIVHHLNVMPGYLASPAGLDGFQECFFCSKASGVALGCSGAFRVAIIPLGAREHPLDEPRSSRHGLGDAIDFNYVDTGRDDHG